MAIQVLNHRKTLVQRLTPKTLCETTFWKNVEKPKLSKRRRSPNQKANTKTKIPRNAALGKKERKRGERKKAKSLLESWVLKSCWNLSEAVGAETLMEEEPWKGFGLLGGRIAHIVAHPRGDSVMIGIPPNHIASLPQLTDMINGTGGGVDLQTEIVIETGAPRIAANIPFLSLQFFGNDEDG